MSNWTTTPPQTEGWYWWRYHGQREVAVKVERVGAWFPGHLDPARVEGLRGEWCRIATHEEVEGKDKRIAELEERVRALEEYLRHGGSDE